MPSRVGEEKLTSSSHTKTPLILTVPPRDRSRNAREHSRVLTVKTENTQICNSGSDKRGQGRQKVRRRQAGGERREQVNSLLCVPHFILLSSLPYPH